MAAKVFISYRRDDSAAYASRIFDRLAKEFGRQALFMDVDSIPAGASFRPIIEEKVNQCDVLLALIGPRWIDARLNDPMDSVRDEIATALRLGTPVVPVLLEGARMPEREQLPDTLVELSLRVGCEVRSASFHAEMERLVRGLHALNV